MDERSRSTGCGRSGEIRNDFLEILLGVDTLTDDEKLSFILDSLLGGYETASLLLSMVVYFLGQCSAALHQAKVKRFGFRILFLGTACVLLKLVDSIDSGKSK